MPSSKAVRHWGWRITTLDDAYRVARESLGGLVFILGLLVGLVATLAAAGGPDPFAVGGMIAVILVVAVLALRVRSGKGWIAGPMLVLLYLVEVAERVWSGQFTNPIGIAISAFVLASLIAGAWACWQVPRREGRGEARGEGSSDRSAAIASRQEATYAEASPRRRAVAS